MRERDAYVSSAWPRARSRAASADVADVHGDADREETNAEDTDNRFQDS